MRTIAITMRYLSVTQDSWQIFPQIDYDIVKMYMHFKTSNKRIFSADLLSSQAHLDLS